MFQDKFRCEFLQNKVIDLDARSKRLQISLFS